MHVSLAKSWRELDILIWDVEEVLRTCTMFSFRIPVILDELRFSRDIKNERVITYSNRSREIKPTLEFNVRFNGTKQYRKKHNHGLRNHAFIFITSNNSVVSQAIRLGIFHRSYSK